MPCDLSPALSIHDWRAVTEEPKAYFATKPYVLAARVLFPTSARWRCSRRTGSVWIGLQVSKTLGFLVPPERKAHYMGPHELWASGALGHL